MSSTANERRPEIVEVLDLQDDDDEPETPGEQKKSGVSYSLCRNSNVSQVFCVHW